MVKQSDTLSSMEIEDSHTINLFDQGKQLSIIELFELYFPREIIQEIIKKTNQNYEQKTINKNKSSREEKWIELTEIELKKYIGIVLMMGIDSKENYTMHWKTHGMWGSKLIRTTMSRDRFQLISTYIKIRDIINEDKLSRIRNLSRLIQ